MLLLVLVRRLLVLLVVLEVAGATSYPHALHVDWGPGVLKAFLLHLFELPAHG
jgi:hypothetical protein